VRPTAACTTSGAGEQVMKAMLAYECVKQLVAQQNADEAIKYTLGSLTHKVSEF
jgi:isoaspartyl peptidase/L-asparaginase-like protein (Ntn-hydrolase superfamily)